MVTIKLGWGRNSSNRLIHISNADNGKSCNCICPDCFTPLVARQGKKVAWHFAHSVPVECTGESVLHKVAKQIIIDAVGLDNSFLIPESAKTLCQYDMIGHPQYESWDIPEYLSTITAAKEEVTLPTNQIADLLIEIKNSSRALAIEIYVTHKKSEDDIDKYTFLEQDCLEIDLADVDWLASEDTIKQAVLFTSKRYWLFHGIQVERKKKLQNLITITNKQYIEQLDSLILPILESKDLSRLDITWKEISSSVSGENSFGKNFVGKATKKPRLTRINLDDNINKIGDGWLTNGLVEEKVKVNVCFIIQGRPRPRPQRSFDNPLLVIEYYPLDSEFEPTWMYISKWQKKLKKMAQEDLQTQLQEDEKRYTRFMEYATNFSRLRDQDRLNLLSNELEINPPGNPGQYLEHWNTTWHVWKTLVWKYKILKKRGSTINVGNISEDKWLAEMLLWPTDEQSRKTRATNIWFWFHKQLEPAGIMEHSGNQYFSISSELPLSFIPWKKLN
tara:strand:+ start:17718 stop:19226 length:1509 start_codon:yes stop_codon:yes gene_type:complete